VITVRYHVLPPSPFVPLAATTVLRSGRFSAVSGVPIVTVTVVRPSRGCRRTWQGCSQTVWLIYGQLTYLLGARPSRTSYDCLLQEKGSAVAAHHEIREVAHSMVARSTDREFSLAGIIAEMKTRGNGYSERTIRTHVTSRMCANAPKNHAIVYNDFWCIDRGSGRYRLFNPETDKAVRL
jgi:hypothetical protein